VLAIANEGVQYLVGDDEPGGEPVAVDPDLPPLGATNVVGAKVGLDPDETVKISPPPRAPLDTAVPLPIHRGWDEDLLVGRLEGSIAGGDEEKWPDPGCLPIHGYAPEIAAANSGIP
jgi:hypothetical protein